MKKPDVLALDDQAQIVEAVQEIRRKLADNRRRHDRLLAQLHMYQAVCTHPTERQEYGNTWGRWPYQKCLDCGKSW